MTELMGANVIKIAVRVSLYVFGCMYSPSFVGTTPTIHDPDNECLRPMTDDMLTLHARHTSAVYQRGDSSVFRSVAPTTSRGATERFSGKNGPHRSPTSRRG